MGSSSKVVRSHIIDQLSRAYGGSYENPIINSLASDFATKNAHTCLTDCPITPFISTFHFHQVGAYDSEVMQLIWGAIATISHFAGAILGALPLCIQNRNGVLDRMKLMAITHYKLLIAHWATRTLFVMPLMILNKRNNNFEYNNSSKDFSTKPSAHFYGDCIFKSRIFHLPIL